MQKKVDHNGWEYFDKLPNGYRRATMDDFHTNGHKKIGLEYLIKWIIKDDYYQVCVVSENLKGENLKPFIDVGRVFVKNQ